MNFPTVMKSHPLPSFTHIIVLNGHYFNLHPLSLTSQRSQKPSDTPDLNQQLQICGPRFTKRSERSEIEKRSSNLLLSRLPVPSWQERHLVLWAQDALWLLELPLPSFQLEAVRPFSSDLLASARHFHPEACSSLHTFSVSGPLSFLCEPQRDGCVEKSHQINSFWNTRTIPSGTNHRGIGFLPHPDAQVELGRAVLTGSACLNALNHSTVFTSQYKAP